MNYSENFGFREPSLNDKYDVGDFNHNTNLIDKNLNELKNQIGNLIDDEKTSGRNNTWSITKLISELEKLNTLISTAQSTADSKAVIDDYSTSPSKVLSASKVNGHFTNTSNPHGVTKSQIGLGSVTNVATESTITQNSSKNITSGAVYTHTSNTSNPHNVTKSQVGLGNVTNVATENTVTKGSGKNITSGGVYNALANIVYPIGSIYISVNNNNPQNYFTGTTWESVGTGRVLQGADSNHIGGSTIEAGLPNITGSITGNDYAIGGNSGVASQWGALSGSDYNRKTAGGDSRAAKYMSTINFNAHDSNSIYGNSTTVQPPAFCVYIWKRIS